MAENKPTGSVNCKRKQKNNEACLQASLLYFLSKISTVELKPLRKKSKLTLPIFHVSKLTFTEEVVEVEDIINERLALVLKTHEYEYDEVSHMIKTKTNEDESNEREKNKLKEKMYHIRDRFEFNFLIDILSERNYFVHTTPVKKHPEIGEGKDRIIQIVDKNDHDKIYSKKKLIVIGNYIIDYLISNDFIHTTYIVDFTTSTFVDGLMKKLNDDSSE